MSSEFPAQEIRRQRVPLVLVSLVLILYELAEVKLSSASVFGLDIELQDPEWVGWVLRIAWFYFFLRYLQWLRELGTPEFHGRFVKELSRYLLAPAAQAVRHSSDFQSEHSSCKSKVSGELTERPVKRSIFGGWDVPIIFYYECSVPKSHSGSQAVQAVVSGSRLAVPYIKAFLAVMWATPFFTEYWLPVALGLVPVVVWLARVVSALAAHLSYLAVR